MPIRIDNAEVRDAVTGELNRALVGQQVAIVVRDTTTPYPIQNGAGDPISGSLLTVQSSISVPTVYIADTEDPSDLYLDWYHAGSGARGPVDFDRVLRDSTKSAAASSASSATSAAASEASAATTATDVAALRGWVEQGVTTRNLVPDPRATDAAKWARSGDTGFTETMITGATDGPLLPDGTRPTTYARYTVTSVGTGNGQYGTANFPVPAAPAGKSIAIAIYVRSSLAVSSISVRKDAYLDGVAAGSAQTSTPAAIAANAWERRAGVIVNNAAHNEMRVTAQFPVGSRSVDQVIDVVCALTVVDATTVPDHWDGDTPSTNLVGYGWEGTRNASPSRRIDMRLTRAIKVAGGTILLPDASGTIDLSSVGGGGGTMDHNQLANLAVGDPHTQYLTPARGDARYDTKAQAASNLSAAVATSSTGDRARANHTGTQGMGTIEGLSAALTSRPQIVAVVNGSETRPEGSAVVFWVGGATQPANMGANDVWLAGAAVTPGDITPPTAPGKPTTSGVAATSLTLTWTAATDNVAVTGYRVRVNGVTVLAPPPSSPAALSRLITGLTPSTAYTFEIGARDANGNWGPYSTPSDSVTTSASADTTPPTAPTGVTASSITASGFMLSWTASTDAVGVTGYRVLIDGVQYAPPAPDTSLAITGRVASTAYDVTVQATDAAGNWSAESTEITVTTSAGGSLPTHSVFATPPAALVKTVEASAYEHATGFYTYGGSVTGWKVKGARLYVPNGISVPTSCEVNLYVPGSTSTPPTLGTPTKTVTLTGITANAWNTVNFPSTTAIAAGQFFWIGIKFADGTWLGVSTFGESFVAASDGSALVLSDRVPGVGLDRNYRRIGTGSTVALTGGTERDIWFGMDVIVEEA